MPGNPWLGTKVQTGTAPDGKKLWGYEWLTVKEAMDQSKLFGAGLMALDLIPEIEADGNMWRMLGLQSKNRKEWILCHQASVLNGGTTVALYDTLGADASRFICNQTQFSTICSSVDLVGAIINLKADDPEEKMSSLKNIISFENNVPSELIQKAGELGIRILTFEEVVQAGLENKEWSVHQTSPDDIYMFSYTSGTTGDPKGVQLSHKMIL